MKRSRVSIIIPCRNAAPYLSECLESALSQTWEFCEVFVIDDRSTDNSVDIARGFARRGVHVLKNRGIGASAARNTGLDAAGGDYIQFLDADDLLESDKIEVQLNGLEELPTSGDVLAMGVWAKFHQDYSQAVFEDEAVYKARTGVEFLQLHYETGSMVQPGAWLTPKILLDRAGRWNEELTLNDDGEFFARVVLASKRIVFTPKARSYYRVGHAGQLSRRRVVSDLNSLFRSVKLTNKWLLQRDCSARSRSAAAHAWMKLAWELYPTAASCARQAEGHGRRLGGSMRSLQIGRKSRIICSIFGWRFAKLVSSFING